MRTNILNLHKRIYKNTKARALSFFGPPSQLFKEYQKDQKKFSLRNFTLSSIEELIMSIQSSNIIYLGDFHTFDQNSKNLQRIIKAICQKRSKVQKDHQQIIVALEMVYGHHQEYINAFLNNDITELEFLESINYHNSWRFPWNHYQVLFELAKTYNFNIYALNSTGNLNARDEYASQTLIDLTRNNPEAVILVLFGELHIVPNKIPQLVQDNAGKLGLRNFSSTIIHQNLDEVYWKMQQDPVPPEQETVVKFQENEFCLQTSPPWVKYESLIYWFENFCEDPEFDIHEYLIETGVKKFSGNINDNFLLLSKEIIKFLKLNQISKNEVEDFNLFDHSRLKDIHQKIQEIENGPLMQFYQYLLMTGQSFKIPFIREYYCASYSINRLAYLVGHHIYDILHDDKENYLEQNLISKNHSLKFLTLIQLSILSYFSSKIINPHRKCDLYQDFNLKSKNNSLPNHVKENYLVAINIIDNHGSIKENFYGRPIKFYYEVAKIVGHFLAEIIYEKFSLEKSHFPLHILQLIVQTEHIKEEFFYDIKKEILKDTNYNNKRKRYF